MYGKIMTYLEEPAGTLHTRTILPRLNFSRGLLGEILECLSEARSTLSGRNARMAGLERYSVAQSESIERERQLRLAVHALSGAREQLDSLSHVGRVPGTMPALIPMIRRISSVLHGDHPRYSAMLCELSSVLGGILVDSASLTGASFDFARSNLDSAVLLDESKLIVDSKLSKLYPNLDSPANMAS